MYYNYEDGPGMFLKLPPQDKPTKLDVLSMQNILLPPIVQIQSLLTSLSIRANTDLLNRIFPIEDSSDLLHCQTLRFFELPPGIEEEENLTSDKDKVIFPGDGG